MARRCRSRPTKPRVNSLSGRERPSLRSPEANMIDQRFILLFGGVGAVLIVASAIGYILSLYAKSDSARATVGNLNDRVRAWWMMVAIFAVAFWFGKIVTLVLFALTSF